MISEILRNSGLFEEHRRPSSEVLRFTVRGREGASIFVQPNEREVHIRPRAFAGNSFPNNAVLEEYVRRHCHRTTRQVGNPAHAYVLAGEHIPGAVDIIRLGMQQED